MSMNDLLTGGHPSINWADIGRDTLIVGTIIASESKQCTVFNKSDELDFWDDEKREPKMQGVVTLQTELRDPTDEADEGVRTLYTGPYKKPGTILGGLRDVLRKKGLKGVEVGGTFAAKWVAGAGVAGDPRQFVVDYAAPEPTAAVNDLLGAGTPAPTQPQQAAPAPEQQPVAASASALL